MTDRTSLGVGDFGRAIEFYTACLRRLGYAPQRIKPDEAAFGTPESWDFFLYPVAPDKIVVGERNHVAFTARGKDQIVDFHRAAVGNGAKSVRRPALRPDIGPDYFGTVLTDLDGHTLEAVFWDRG